MNLLNLVLISAVTTVEVVKVVRIALIVALLVCALAMVVLVLLQPSASEGMGAISGQSYDTFYSKNKGRTSEGVMKRLTIVLAICMLLFTIAFFITGYWYNI